MREDGAEETPGSEFTPVTMEVAHENTDPGILGGTGLLHMWLLRYSLAVGTEDYTIHTIVVIVLPDACVQRQEALVLADVWSALQVFQNSLRCAGMPKDLCTFHPRTLFSFSLSC